MEKTITIEKTDEDILHDLNRLVRSYKPIIMSRGRFQYSVRNGVVTLTGNINTKLNRVLFLDELAQLDGVVALNDTHLYDDDTLRITIGKLLPEGVRVRCDHGAVKLIGRLPQDVSAEELQGRVAEVPGVRAVTTHF